jgi:hypothetical protein
MHQTCFLSLLATNVHIYEFLHKAGMLINHTITTIDKQNVKYYMYM